MNSLPGNDHAAVSKFRTEGVHEWQSREGETDATCIAMAIDANTEATLALAFEQRTANLIDQLSMRIAALGKDIELKGEVMDELNARLGLNGDAK